MKIVAFYLPQFHEIAENNKWWGKGYTEWVNVKKSRSLFPGHCQPRIPYKENYYDLSDVNVMKWQSKLAQKYGVDAFCFYHYWFDGKKLLEKPVENYLNCKEIKSEFCLAWANEPWTRTWQGPSGGNEVLIRQRYGENSEWKKHFEYLLDFFKDKRYIKKDNKPVLLIYRTGYMVKSKEMFEEWNRLAKENGFSGLHIVSMLSAVDKYENNKFIEATVDFEPGKTRREDNMFGGKTRNIKDYIIDNIKPHYLLNKFLGNIMDYDDVNKEMLVKIHKKNEYRGVFVGYDDSPRRGIQGTIVQGSTPTKFEYYLRENLELSLKEENDLLFVNAWNEWGESNYLEPDNKYGFAYLHAIKNAKKFEGTGNK